MVLPTLALVLLHVAPSFCSSTPTDRTRAQAPVVANPSVRVETILDGCDRFVTGFIVETRELASRPVRPANSSGVRDCLARLHVQDAPFGAVSERLWVYVRGQGPGIGERAAWPLEELRLHTTDHWEGFDKLRQEVGVETLWMPSQVLRGPWIVEYQGAQDVVQVPGDVVTSSGSGGALVELAALVRQVSDQLTRAVPRFEHCFVSLGPSGSLDTRISPNGSVLVQGKVTRRASDEEHKMWLDALERSSFATLPRRVGTSTGPCEPLDVLGYVTTAGRRQVALKSMLPPTASAAERDQFRRANELLSAFRVLVPNDR